MHKYPYQGSIVPAGYKGRQRYLHATSAASSTAWWRGALAIGMIFASNPRAFAGSEADPINIPLHHLKDQGRLGILIGANGGSAKMYMFDTGSDQFNGQFYPKDALENAGPKAVYGYGDGTYGYRLQPVSIKNLTYYNADGKTVAYNDQRKQVVAQIEDHVFTANYKPLPGEKLNLDKSNPIVANGLTYYADLNARSKIAEGVSAETDTTFGTFGAGDFLMTDSANSSAIGGLTKSGYIVSANANLDGAVTPGCSPCTIVNLNENLRAQYETYIPWGTQDRTGFQPTFPGSNANASTQFEGNYTYTFKFKVNGTVKTVTIDGPALFDTGTSNSVYLNQKGVLSRLQSEGLVLNENSEVKLDSLSIAPPGQADQGFTFENVDVSRLAGETEGNGLILGLPFFQQNSVIYDLENKMTGYSPLFVSADNFSTDAGSGDQPHLGRITAQMGNSGLFGIAGVISGTGNLTLDAKTFVRLTNVNTFTGSTIVSKDANLSLAGQGSIEKSTKVVLDGSLDISERGNANKNWGISDSVKDARIRSLSGGSSGVLTLGNQNLILTAANDAFAGSITDLDEKKHYGGGVIVAGGVQTLSGKNDYTGMTEVNKGAGLLLTDTGSLSHDVTTSGLFGNDGVIDGTAFTKDSGVVTGAGTFGAIAIANGGAIAPGSTTDSANQIVALTVKGNFTQEAGSIYGAGLGKSSDLIDVKGSASIDTGAKVELVREGAISIDTRYNLLTAASGVNGTYGGLTGALATDSPFVDFELIYDANNVFLDTERTATTFAGVAESLNQRSTAAASEALGTGNVIHDSILSLTRQESLNAFDLLSGEIHASTKSALIEESRFERDAVNDRLRAAFEGVGTTAMPVLAYGEGGPVLAPATTDRLAAWGTAFGSWGSFDGNGNAATLDTSTGGFLTGFDGLVNESIRLGLMAGYSHSSFHADGRSSASSDNYHLGLYGGTQWGAVGFRSGLAYSWHDIETSRLVVIPGFADSLSGDYDAGTFQAFGELGYRIDTTVAAFEPFANLAYVNLRSDGFRESGGAAALSGHSETTETTFTTLGLRVSSDFTLGTMKSVARGTLGWRHAYGDVTPRATHSFAAGEAFTVAGVPIAEDSAVIEAGLDLNMTESATVGVSYQGQFGSGVQQNGFNAKLNIRF
ncbi:autotransporter outer membrane beta-barrel domain-containing protein [Phyllobacterium sp. K27]